MKLSAFWIPATVSLVATGTLFADGGAQHRVKQTAPVKMGTSGGSVDDHSRLYCCSGTLGALVVRDGVTCILSNNHVLASSGSGVAGEDTLQPGLIDTNCSGTNSNIVGDFIGNLVPLGSANVDVGISIARAGMCDSSGAILDIGVPCSTPQNGTIGMAVMKSGRTTGFTTGSITSVNTSVTIQYQKGCNTGKKFNISFTGQLMTGAMSAGGDSGSVLYSNDGTPNPVGLLFAGSSSTTIYNPVQGVVNALTAGGHTFSFVGNNCGPAPDGGTGTGPSVDELAAAQRVQVENESDLFRIPGVIGVGIGAAEDNPDEAVIVVYTMGSDDPARATIPTQIDGFRVRTILTDRFVAQ
jgi:hypothetical protein